MEIREIGKKPTDENPPVGVNAAELEEYEFLDDEISKMTSPTASGAVDWPKVEQVAASIISDKSKHFTVCCYLFAAMAETKSLRGMADGVAIMLGMVTEYWETMYPPKKRMRGRVNSLDWLKERLDAITEKLPDEVWTSADLENFRNDLNSLDSFFGENMEGAPVLRSTIESLLSHISVDEAAEPQPQIEQKPVETVEEEPVTMSEQVVKEVPAEGNFTGGTLGSEPISADNPTGDDPSEDERYEALQSEVDKLTSMADVGGVDWQKVEKLSSDILKNKSKHFLVAAYYGAAQVEINGVGGVHEAVHTLADMVENYWDSMFPPVKRIKARLNSAQWWLDRVKGKLANLEPVQWTQGKYDELVAEMKRLDNALAEKSDDAPIFHSLLDILENAITCEVAPEAKAEPAKAPEPVTEKPKVAKVEKVETPQVDVSGGDKDKILPQIISALAGLAETLGSVDKYNPLVFKLTRMGAWADVNDAPYCEDGKTLIPPPDDQYKDILMNSYQAQQWENLVEISESRVAQYLFWLDLSMYSVKALRGLGQEAAAKAVEAETADYISRVEGLEKLCFSDGMPFASEETKGWLSSLSQSDGGGIVVTEETPVKITEANALIAGNNFDEGLSTLMTGVKEAKGDKEKIVWLRAICSAMMNAGKKNGVAAFARQIESIAEEHDLGGWSPVQAADVYDFLIRCYRFHDEEGNSKTINNLKTKILQIDPSRWESVL